MRHRVLFASVPGSVRERYPSQCMAFSSVEVPHLAQNGAGMKLVEFFGGKGANPA